MFPHGTRVRSSADEEGQGGVAMVDAQGRWRGVHFGDRAGGAKIAPSGEGGMVERVPKTTPKRAVFCHLFTGTEIYEVSQSHVQRAIVTHKENGCGGFGTHYIVKNSYRANLTNARLVAA
jgi:hypothetical protein